MLLAWVSYTKHTRYQLPFLNLHNMVAQLFEDKDRLTNSLFSLFMCKSTSLYTCTILSYILYAAVMLSKECHVS